MHIAVVGSGAAGLAAAWLLSKQHRVTLLEQDDRLGGHAHTATVSADVPDNSDDNSGNNSDNGQKIDTGFIVYNEPSYPNLTRWFEAMNVTTEASDMSFAVSRDDGEFEYAGGPLLGLFAQPTLLLRARFWRMLVDLLRFYREAAKQIPADSSMTLHHYLQKNAYSSEFIEDHLLPFGAAIWSTSKSRMLDYPAAAFIRFCDNHGLLRIMNRPQWRTVSGGSERYVQAVEQAIGAQSIKTGFTVNRIERHADHVVVYGNAGQQLQADQVVVAAHADQALRLLDQPSDLERALLSPFNYESNLAILHTDTSYLPKRRRAWCSWNYVERSGSDTSRVSVSYWMNRLQNIASQQQYVVTLNPTVEPAAHCVLRKVLYQHPVFTSGTWAAQQSLWSMQGQNRTWFCGSYFGAGFHEDAVQAGFAVAEQLGGLARPWTLDNPSSRIVVPASQSAMADRIAA